MKFRNKWPQFLVLSLLLTLSLACQKDEEIVTIKRNWRVTYSVLAISDITINNITYVDEFGLPQTVPGDRNFSFSIDAETGFIARLSVDAEAVNGGVVATIDAQALDGSLENEVASADGGHSGTAAQPVQVSVELRLP